jgi:hypothetical protein
MRRSADGGSRDDRKERKRKRRNDEDEENETNQRVSERGGREAIDLTCCAFTPFACASSRAAPQLENGGIALH